MAPFDALFADPPYGKGLGERALAAARDGGWLKPGALCIVEEAAASPPQPVSGFEKVDERAYGDTVLTFLRSGSRN